MSQEKNVDNLGTLVQKATSEEAMRERFYDTLKANNFLHDASDAMYTANADFFKGDGAFFQQLGYHSVVDIDKFLRTDTRSKYQSKVQIAEAKAEQLVSQVPSKGPKGWIKGLSFFGKKERAGSASPAAEHKDEATLSGTIKKR